MRLGIYPKEIFNLKNAEGFKKEQEQRLKDRGDEHLLQRNES